MSLILKNPRSISSSRVLGTLCVSLLMGACSQKIQPSVQADPNVTKSFSSTDAQQLLRNNSVSGLSVESVGRERYLVIQKSALDKEFLFASSAISQKVAATSSGLQSRVVAFSRKGERLFLVEATEGHVVSPSLPSSLILAEIPILLEEENQLVVDFDAGMSTLFTLGNWHVSDISGRTYPKTTHAAVSVVRSYIEKIETLDEQYLEIRQIAQLSLAANVEPYEIRYFLSPYQKSETYKPLESDISYDRAGFFEAPPILEKKSGRPIVHATIFDPAKPIVFSISANTPKEYVEAVKDGILYWNRAFGKDIIKVEMAPEGATAPDPRRNIVQWVEWDQAGFAYADALMDPRTGEIKHAQVYMTSAFAWGSTLNARRVSRLLNTSSSEESRSDAFISSLGLKGMETSSLCRSDRSGQIAQVAQVALNSSLSDEAILRLSQDYVREVIAHEIGHTLGLRHNFAGNLDSNKSPEEMQARFNELAQDETVRTDDIIPSNSVMEYQAFAEGVINGRQMARGEPALAYDAYAVRKAYLGEEFQGRTPLFCTDSHANTHQDCVRFDRGRNPIEGARYAFALGIQNMPVTFVESFLTKIGAANDIERGGVSSVEPDPKRIATTLVAEAKTMLSYLDASKKSIILERRYEILSSLKDKDLIVDRYQWLSSIADEKGSWQDLFFSNLLKDESESLLSSNWVEHKVSQVKSYLAKPHVRSFVGRDGVVRNLSDADVGAIESRSVKFFAELQQQILGQLLASYKDAKWTLEIAATGSIEDDGLLLSVEDALATIVPTVALMKSNNKVQIPLVDGTQGEVFDFLFSAPVRQSAIALAAPAFVDLVGWAKDTRETTREAYRNILVADLGVSKVKELDAAVKAGNRKVQIWWKGEKPVWTAIGGSESPAEADPKPETKPETLSEADVDSEDAEVGSDDI